MFKNISTQRLWRDCKIWINQLIIHSCQYFKNYENIRKFIVNKTKVVTKKEIRDFVSHAGPWSEGRRPVLLGPFRISTPAPVCSRAPGVPCSRRNSRPPHLLMRCHHSRSARGARMKRTRGVIATVMKGRQLSTSQRLCILNDSRMTYLKLICLIQARSFRLTLRFTTRTTGWVRRGSPGNRLAAEYLQSSGRKCANRISMEFADYFLIQPTGVMRCWEVGLDLTGDRWNYSK